MKKGKKILLIVLPLCFLSWNGRTFLGTKQASISMEHRKVLNANTILEDEKADVDELFDSSIEKADEAIESYLIYEKANIGKEYINFYADGDSRLLSYHQEMKERFSFFSEYIKEAQTYLEEYSEDVACFSNLNYIFSSDMNVEKGELKATEDFICDQGMIDFVTDLNGGFISDFGYEEPTEILNPEYQDAYSVYSEVIADREESDEDDTDEAGSVSEGTAINCVGLQLALANMTTVLSNQGLSYFAVETIKASFFSIKEAVLRIMTFLAKLAIIVAAIIALTIVFVIYWKQIKMIANAIIDMFVSVSKGFEEKVRKLFSSILEKTRKSEGEILFDLEGKKRLFRALTTAFAKELDEYGNRNYHRAIVSTKTNKKEFEEAGFNSEYAYVELESMTETEAIDLMRSDPNDPYYHNVYTFRRSRAKRVIKNAFSQFRIREDSDRKQTTGWRFRHFHAYKRDSKQKAKENHSFFGLPYRAEEGEK